jgi:hypothetical protein
MLFQDLDDRTSEAIRTEPTAYPADREPGNSVTAPRWRAPFRRVTRQEVFYGRWNAALTRIDVVSRPFTDSGPGSEVVVVDTMTAVDAYPFAFGQKYLIAGVNNAASGVLLVFKDGHYNTVATGIPYDPYEPPQTSFPPPPEGAPAYALSFENFVWNGHLYASYHVSDKNERGPNCGMPSCLATEIWVVRFDNTDPDSLTVAGLCRVSGIVGDVVPPEPNRFLSLMDPEPVVVQDGAILYYNRTNIDTGLGELWRIRLGTEPEFAAACAAPENLVVVENPET